MKEAGMQCFLVGRLTECLFISMSCRCPLRRWYMSFAPVGTSSLNIIRYIKPKHWGELNLWPDGGCLRQTACKPIQQFSRHFPLNHMSTSLWHLRKSRQGFRDNVFHPMSEHLALLLELNEDSLMSATEPLHFSFLFPFTIRVLQFQPF